MKTKTRSAAALLGVILGASLLIGGGNPAVAAVPASPSSGRIDQTNMRAPETLLGVNEPLSKTQATQETVFVETPAKNIAIVPAIGESITVEYADAITTYETLRAGCTQSSTAGKPYKSSTYVRASMSWTRSSGCAGKVDAGANVESLSVLWTNRGSDVSAGMPAGVTWSANIRSSRNCSSGSKKWRSNAWFSYISLGASTSGQVTLACG